MGLHLTERLDEKKNAYTPGSEDHPVLDELISRQIDEMSRWQSDSKIRNYADKFWTNSDLGAMSDKFCIVHYVMSYPGEMIPAVVAIRIVEELRLKIDEHRKRQPTIDIEGEHFDEESVERARREFHAQLLSIMKHPSIDVK